MGRTEFHPAKTPPSIYDYRYAGLIAPVATSQHVCIAGRLIGSDPAPTSIHQTTTCDDVPSAEEGRHTVYIPTIHRHRSPGPEPPRPLDMQLPPAQEHRQPVVGPHKPVAGPHNKPAAEQYRLVPGPHRPVAEASNRSKNQN